MTDDEREDILARLVKMQKTLRDVKDACDYQAAMCKAAGSSSMAFATIMVGESIMAYSKELAKFVKSAVDE